MKRIYIILILLSVASLVSAQQAGQYSLNQLNPFRYNPAYAGLDNSLSATGIYRTQWTGIQGNPTYFTANAHMPLYFLQGGIGINIEQEELGASEWLKADIAYNYQLQLGKKGVLSLGLDGGIIQYTLDGAQLRTPEGEYIEGQTAIDHKDDLLPISIDRGMAPTFDFGAYYQSETFFGGLAVQNLSGARISLSTLEFLTERTYIAEVGANFEMNRTLTLTPYIYVKSDLIQTQTDVSVLLKYENRFFGGVTYRGYDRYTSDALVFIGGIRLNEKMNLAYAYDLTLSQLRNYSAGSHEILINYNLGKPIGKGKLPGIIYNPRSR